MKCLRNFCSRLSGLQTIIANFILLLAACGVLLDIFINKYILHLLDTVSFPNSLRCLIKFVVSKTNNGWLRRYLIRKLCISKEKNYKHLDWINMVIKFIWPRLNDQIQKWIETEGSSEIETGGLKFYIREFQIGKVPPQVIYLMIHDESSYQVNPNQMVVDIGITYQSECIAIIDCVVPIIGTVSGGFENLSCELLFRIIFRPVSLSGFGGLCVELLLKPKYNLNGLRAASLINLPMIKQFIANMIDEHLPTKYCIPFKKSKVRQVTCPTPYAMCMYKVAFKSPLFNESAEQVNQQVHLKIAEKLFKISISSSIDEAVWYSCDVNDFIDYFIISRKQIGANDGSSFRIKFGSLVTSDKIGRYLDFPSGDTGMDELTIQVIIFRLKNTLKNLDNVIELLNTKWPRQILPIGYLVIYLDCLDFEESAIMCFLSLKYGRSLVSFEPFVPEKEDENEDEDEDEVEGGTVKNKKTIRIEESINLPYIKRPHNVGLVFQLLIENKLCEYKLTLDPLFKKKFMADKFQVTFKSEETQIAKLNCFVEVTSIAKKELELMFTKKIFSPPPASS